ncbi:MAG: hypothetical protein CLLPBCKN_004263 [Chroococcidiopsis cubana SAG 39.79]|nr:hypothetical protein [Chroococcidiopsis cubana SAG 39.79]
MILIIGRKSKKAGKKLVLGSYYLSITMKDCKDEVIDFNQVRVNCKLSIHSYF